MQRRDFVRGAAATAALAAWPDHLRAFPRGAPSRPPLLNAHAHVNSQRVADHLASLMGRRVLEPLDGAEIIRRLDRMGIRRAFVLSTAYMMASDVGHPLPPDEEQKAVAAENDFAAAQAALAPDRLIPFLSVNPKRDYATAEIDRAVDRNGMRGLKLHFWNSMVDLRQPDQLVSVKRAIDHAAARGLPVVGHVYIGAVKDFGPDDIDRIIDQIILPNEGLRFSFAHLGGAGGFAGVVQRIFARLVERVGPGHPAANRVFADMAVTLLADGIGPIPATPPAARARMGELLQGWGLDRVYWGSDTFEASLAQTEAAWPLDEVAWDRLASNTGNRFLGS